MGGEDQRADTAAGGTGSGQSPDDDRFRVGAQGRFRPGGGTSSGQIHRRSAFRYDPFPSMVAGNAEECPSVGVGPVRRRLCVRVIVHESIQDGSALEVGQGGCGLVVHVEHIEQLVDDGRVVAQLPVGGRWTCIRCCSRENDGRPFSSRATISPSTIAFRPLSAAMTASGSSGKVPVMSRPLRLNRRHRPPRVIAIARCPSHFISNAHPPPTGGILKAASIGVGGDQESSTPLILRVPLASQLSNRRGREVMQSDAADAGVVGVTGVLAGASGGVECRRRRVGIRSAAVVRCDDDVSG